MLAEPLLLDPAGLERGDRRQRGVFGVQVAPPKKAIVGCGASMRPRDDG
jgi:hypothetical protein